MKLSKRKFKYYRKAYICCVHHSKDSITLQELDPRNYKYQPPCVMEKIKPAGKPTKKSESLLNLFR